jgi:NADH-quinone oxidoreductase subunit G
VLRVTARKDQWGEAVDFICNECRFEKKKTSDWKIEGPSHIARTSVISQNHYEHLNELKLQVMKQQKALGFMDINKRP